MPVVGIPVDRLNALVGRTVGPDELVWALQRMGCDIEGFATLRRFRCVRCGYVLERTPTEADPGYCDNCHGDFGREGTVEVLAPVEVLRMELLAVRPDMFDVGGLARALRTYLGITPGLATYDLAPPRVRVTIDPGLDEATCFRPSIACAVIRGVKFDDDLLREVMRLQENLHWALGRDRRRASIGVYDLGVITPPVTYRPVEPEGIVFRPLGWAEAATPRRILQEHPKGKAFAHLLEGFTRYPLLIDAAGLVLSLPPIINGEETKVTGSTGDLFVDVTGPRPEAVRRCLNVLVTSLLECVPGARAERVELVGPPGTEQTPDLRPQEMDLDLDATRRLLGISFADEEALVLLERMGHRVEPEGRGRVKVFVPAFRPDFLHPRDLMEDLAIAFGYDRIVPTLVPTMTVGHPHPVEARASVCRRALTGLGLIEVMTLLLGSEETHYAPFGLRVPDDAVLIANPISAEQTLGRTWLIPGLVDTLARNTSREMPHRVFEVGPVMRVDEAEETGATQSLRAAVALAGPAIGFADIRSVLGALLAELGVELLVRPLSRPYYLEGRAAALLSREGACIGEMGELHPAVLERFKIIQPVVVGEIEVA